MRRIRDVIWIDAVVDKIQTKHGIAPEEVEWVLEHRPHVRYIERGHVQGEDVYQAYGQTAAGRYLVVFFILKRDDVALPITARSMTANERRLYVRQKKSKD